ncbi:cation:proton antiporter [Virgisporangium aurantiacum]
MTSGVLAAVGAAVFAWGVLSARLQRADLTAPIVFVALGVSLSAAISTEGAEAESLKILAETTLVWVLFSDAARVGVRELRSDAGLYVRLLAVALPITAVAGWLSAWALFGGLGLWLALFVGAALAPTDAALGAVVITHPAVPVRIRRVLNVESGLNDGIITPVVLVALAGAASEHGHGGGAVHALVQLALGVVVGVVVAGAGAGVLRTARRRGWIDEAFAGPAVLALALVCYTLAVTIDANGFIAAFVGGIAFGHVAGRGHPGAVVYVEQTAGLTSLLVWLIVGAVAVPIILDHLSWQVLLYAVLSLTVMRMVPVAATLVGAGLKRPAVLFIGWFGPRGLASVVFALLAIEEVGDAAGAAVAVVVTTVLLSVVAHGLTASPLAERFGARMATGDAAATDAPTPRSTSRLGRPVPGEPRHPEAAHGER